MKKFLSTAMIIAMLAVTATGCAGNNNSTSDSSVSDSGSSSDTSSESDAESSVPETSALTAEQMAANILTTVEWPHLMNITDAETANTVLGIDLNMVEDYYISIPAMSAHVTEIILIKPKAGSEDAIKEAVKARFDYVQETGAFYPMNEEVVAGAVTGVTDSGYVYTIVHTEGKKCEENMLNNPPAEMPSADAETPDAGATEGMLYASEMAANVLASAEWPSLMPITDMETVLSATGIDITLTDDYYVAMPAMSAHVTEIIFVKPTAGNEEAIQTALDNHFDYVQENGAFYPTNEEVVAGAVKGTTESGYLYMIVHTDGAKCEENIMNNPPAEMPEM